MFWFDFLWVGTFGLIIGSFLNVLILRLPKMLQTQWHTQCHEYVQEHHPSLAALLPPTQTTTSYNLMTPASHCPHCNHPIGILENIPVLSFVFLRGRCRICQHPISWRYPIIEILTALFTVITVAHFGFSYLAIAACILTWGLIALSVIDIEHFLLPDNLVLPLLWLGIGLNFFDAFTDLQSSIIGVMAGYVFLWSVFWIFKLLTGKEGMGYGDFKLFALFGAWLGWQALPAIILMASVVGMLVGLGLIFIKRHKHSDPIPFGPFLATAGWISLLWGDTIQALLSRISHG